MVEDTTLGGDIENVGVESATGDIENPVDVKPSSDGVGASSSKHDTSGKKWKAIALFTFLVAIVVLSIALGVTLGSDGGNMSASAAEPNNGGESLGSDSDAGAVVGSDGGAIDTANATTTLPSLSSETEPTLTSILSSSTLATTDPTQTEGESDATTTSTTLPTEVESTNASTTTPPDNDDDPQVYKAQYLKTDGPLEAKVLLIDPTVANGYSSCDEMKEDIRNALRHHANKIIVEQSQNNWYESCDPNNPNNWWIGGPETDVMFMGEGGAADVDFAADESVMAESAPAAPGVADGAAPAKVTEDSFETNVQVEGVDEADIVKSDGVHVYAAYGDVLYAWPAANGTKSMSITKMPYEKSTEDCPYHKPIPEPLPMPTVPIISVEAVEEELVEDSTEAEPAQSISSTSRGGNRHRKASMMEPDYWNPCHIPKPRILALLLEGSRLTAVVSEQRGYGWYNRETDAPTPIIDDSNKLSIRVYDVSSVPDQGQLPLIGQREIKGNYHSARSTGSTGYVITTSYLNTGSFSNDLYRHRPQYCGLSSSEYESLAAESALNNTDSFIDRMVDELQLQLDGTCSSMFKIAAMQSGDSDEDHSNGDLLSQFTQVLSFDMAAVGQGDSDVSSVNGEVEVEEISTNVAAAFSSGWLSQLYASHNFAATLNVGSSYDKALNRWEQSTFILGFDISGIAPRPFSYAEIRGEPLNQYSADLFEGHLRVVTTETNWQDATSRTKNKIHILRVPTGNEGQEMKLVGESPHVGKPNERVYAVRFMQDKAYIVTFEQIDPFYIWDLSEPSEPKQLGELEIPGFSSYLHPIEIDGDALMLGVGEHIDPDTSRRVGVKISLFNITDPTNPTETAHFVDDGAYSSAGNDFKAFRFLPISKKLIIPQSKYTYTDLGNFDGFVVYDVSTDAITPSYKIQHASSYDMHHYCWSNRRMPARSLVFQSKLTTILSHSVLSTDLENDGELLWSINLDEGLNNTVCSPYFY